MRIYALLCLSILVTVSLLACDTVTEGEVKDVPFRELNEAWVGATTDRVQLVLRTKEEWDAAPVGSNAPTPNFTDSLVLAVSHGPIMCTHKGGGFERIELVDNVARISFEPLEERPPPHCAAGMPLDHLVQVSKEDLPQNAAVSWETPDGL